MIKCFPGEVGERTLHTGSYPSGKECFCRGKARVPYPISHWRERQGCPGDEMKLGSAVRRENAGR